MKKLILINILFWALCIFIPMQVKADPKTEATVGHVISETSNGTDIDIYYIMEKELEAIAAAVVGGCLLTGGYGSAIGAAFGALIFGTVSMGIFYTDVDTDWFKVFLGAMMLIAVVFNNYIRKKVTESK